MTLKRLHPAACKMGNGGHHIRWHLGSRDAIHERSLYVVGTLAIPDAEHEYTIHRLGEPGREYSLYCRSDDDIAYCSCPGFKFTTTGQRRGSVPGTPCKQLMLIRHLALRGELPDGPVEGLCAAAPTRRRKRGDPR